MSLENSWQSRVTKVIYSRMYSLVALAYETETGYFCPRDISRDAQCTFEYCIKRQKFVADFKSISLIRS